jgi:type II secretory ATPase GspE/PulE/Tfp pilus assembly ATPase PilB-like protein
MSSKIITNILKLATQEGASHLAIARRANKVALDYHFPDGQIRSFSLPKKLEQTFFSSLERILAIVPGNLITQKYCELNDKNGSLKYYLTVLPAGNEERIVISLVKHQDKLFRLNQLGLQTTDLQTLKKITHLRSGLVIISSPPQSGKSTTLYSLLHTLNKSDLNIYLLSRGHCLDIPGLNKLEPTMTNWEKILHHDSEIIGADGLDKDWALKNALLAAASGRLVLGTMMADSAQEVLDKISQINLPAKLKTENLKLIINQRLVNLKRPAAKSRNPRQIIGVFEILKLGPKNNFKPLTLDHRQKVKAGLI